MEQIALSVCVRIKIYWSSGYLKSCTTKEETSPTRWRFSTLPPLLPLVRFDGGSSRRRYSCKTYGTYTLPHILHPRWSPATTTAVVVVVGLENVQFSCTTVGLESARAHLAVPRFSIRPSLFLSNGIILSACCFLVDQWFSIFPVDTCDGVWIAVKSNLKFWKLIGRRNLKFSWFKNARRFAQRNGSRFGALHTQRT